MTAWRELSEEQRKWIFHDMRMLKREWRHDRRVAHAYRAAIAVLKAAAKPKVTKREEFLAFARKAGGFPTGALATCTPSGKKLKPKKRRK